MKKNIDIIIDMLNDKGYTFIELDSNETYVRFETANGCSEPYILFGTDENMLIREINKLPFAKIIIDGLVELNTEVGQLRVNPKNILYISYINEHSTFVSFNNKIVVSYNLFDSVLVNESFSKIFSKLNTEIEFAKFKNENGNNFFINKDYINSCMFLEGRKYNINFGNGLHEVFEC